MPTIGADAAPALELRTARLVLRLATRADADDLQAAIADWQIIRYTARIPYPYPEGGALAWASEAESRHRAGPDRHFVLRRGSDGGFIGVMAVTREEEGGGYELGYWLARPAWGQGYATEAGRAVVAHALSVGLVPLHADVRPQNPASIRVLEKLGLREAARLDKWHPARGESHEVIRFALAVPEPTGCDPGRPAATLPPLPTVLVVAAALVDVDGRILLAERPAGKPMAGLWEFPGGKVHAGETPEAALVRELREELSIDTAESCLAPIAFASHRYEAFHLLMPLYVCRRWNGTVRPREGQRVAWVRPARLGDYPMPPADIPLVALLRDYL